MSDKKMTLPELIDALRPITGRVRFLLELEAVLQSAYDAVREVEASKTERAAAIAASAASKIEADSQKARAAEAKKATDDIVAACKDLAEKAKAEKAAEEKKLADYMREAQSIQGKKQVELNKGLEKYLAEMEAAKAASRQVYEADKAKLAAEYESLVSRKGQLQKEVDDLKKKLGTIFNS